MLGLQRSQYELTDTSVRRDRAGVVDAENRAARTVVAMVAGLLWQVGLPATAQAAASQLATAEQEQQGTLLDHEQLSVMLAFCTCSSAPGVELDVAFTPC